MANIKMGIAAFQAGKFEVAISHFDEAIKEKPEMLNLYDSRAACYEKLGKIKLALADAKKVIDLRPDLPKGYLRSARLFKKARKLDNAIKMYQLAIAKTPSDAVASLQVEISEVQASKVAQDIAEEKLRTNYIGDLPADTFVDIMHYLSPLDIFRCSRVGSFWRKLIFATPSLWQTLSITDHTRHPANKFRFWVQRLEGSSKGLSEVTINSIDQCWDTVSRPNFMDLLTQADIAKSLQVFRVGRRCKNQGQALLDFACTQRTSLRIFTIDLGSDAVVRHDITSFLSLFPCLEELAMVGKFGSSLGRVKYTTPKNILTESLPRLRRLYLDSMFFLYSTQPTVLPSLECVTFANSPAMNDDVPYPDPVIDWTQLPNLRTLRLTPAYAGFDFLFPRKPLWDLPSLEVLVVLRRPTFITFPGAAPASPTVPRILQSPRLRSLELGGMKHDETTEFLCVNAPQHPLLETLVLKGVILRGASARFDLVFSSFPRLTYLDVSRTEFPNEGLDALTKHSSALVYLDISHCEGLTGTPLMRLIEARGNTKGGVNGLTDLKMEGCKGVAQEAVVWIKERVKRVAFKNWDPKWEGKAVKKLRLS